MAEYISTSPIVSLSPTGSNPDNYIKVTYIDSNFTNFISASPLESSQSDFIYKSGGHLTGRASIYSASVNLKTGEVTLSIYVTSVEYSPANYEIRSRWNKVDYDPNDAAQHYFIKDTASEELLPLREFLPIIDPNSLTDINQFKYQNNSMKANISGVGDDWVDGTVINEYRIGNNPLKSPKSGCTPTFDKQLFLGYGSNDKDSEGTQFYTLYKDELNDQLVIVAMTSPYHSGTEIEITKKIYKPGDFRDGVIPDKLIFIMQGQGGAGCNQISSNVQVPGGASGSLLILVVDISWTHISRRLGFSFGTKSVDDSAPSNWGGGELPSEYGVTTRLYKHPLIPYNPQYLAQAKGGGDSRLSSSVNLDNLSASNLFVRGQGRENYIDADAVDHDLWILFNEKGLDCTWTSRYTNLVGEDASAIDVYSTKIPSLKDSNHKLKTVKYSNTDIFNNGEHSGGISKPNYGGNGGSASHFGDGGAGGAGVGGSAQATDGSWGAGGGGARNSWWTRHRRGRGGTGFVAIFY